MKIIFGILFISALFLASCNSENQAESDGGNKSEIKLSQIRLKDLTGDFVSLEQFRGKTVFLNFWATWCKPCLAEMPSIQSAMEKLKGENIEYFFASDESVNQIQNFENMYDYPFNYVRVENIEELNIMALPTTFIFDSSGLLVYSEMGFRKWDEKQNIDLLLNIIKSK